MYRCINTCIAFVNKFCLTKPFCLTYRYNNNYCRYMRLKLFNYNKVNGLIIKVK